MPVKDIKLLDVDIKRMTKDPNPGIFIFPFFVRCVCGGGGGGGGRAVQGRAGQGEVLAGEWVQLFSYVTHCINLKVCSCPTDDNSVHILFLYFSV